MWAQPFALFMQQPDHLLKGGNRVFFNLALKSWNSCHKNKKLYMKPWGQITHWFQEFSIELLCVRATREGEIMVSYQYLNFLMFFAWERPLSSLKCLKNWKTCFLLLFFSPNPIFEIENSRIEWKSHRIEKCVLYVIIYLIKKKPNQAFCFYHSSFRTPVTYLNTGKYSLWQGKKKKR